MAETAFASTKEAQAPPRLHLQQLRAVGDTPGWCYTFHLDTVNRSVYIHEIMIMSWKKRKLDRLKMNSKGATNEAPTCAVAMHAPQTSTLWQGMGEVSSAGEVGC